MGMSSRCRKISKALHNLCNYFGYEIDASDGEVAIFVGKYDTVVNVAFQTLSEAYEAAFDKLKHQRSLTSTHGHSMNWLYYDSLEDLDVQLTLLGVNNR